ncbi:MAG: molybdenum cofactor guanylyltransferase [Luteolibacter sp.]
MKRALKGIVLAGGRSSRMGTDKAALRHADGRTLARRGYDLLLVAGCEAVLLSLRADQALPPGFEDLENVGIVRDVEGESHGPMAGMVGGMRTDRDADWLIVACDLPRLDEATLRGLVSGIREREKFLAYRSEFDGLPEPLAALYACEALPLLEQAHVDEMRCPRKILIRNGCRLLEPMVGRALENTNTPEEWETAMKS